MTHLESLAWAFDKILPNKPATWFCENCGKERPMSQLITEEDPQIPGLHVHFCSTACCKKWMEKDATLWS
jgi:hypothetical protein